MHSDTAPTKFSAIPLSWTGLHCTVAKTAKTAIFFHIFEQNLMYSKRVLVLRQRWASYDIFPKIWWILSFDPHYYFVKVT